VSLFSVLPVLPVPVVGDVVVVVVVAAVVEVAAIAAVRLDLATIGFVDTYILYVDVDGECFSQDCQYY